jgi:hypothetical protein
MNLLHKYADFVASLQFRWRKTLLANLPNCNQQIDLALALRLSGWSKWAPSNFGVRCPNCKMILAARQHGGFAAFWAVLAVVSAIEVLAIVTGHLTRTNMARISLALGLFALFMHGATPVLD